MRVFPIGIEDPRFVAVDRLQRGHARRSVASSAPSGSVIGSSKRRDQFIR
jgi:hypothetical protein